MIATKVGASAPNNRPIGLTLFSLKYSFKIDIPAGFGAFAMTVKPPPVTAPSTNYTLNSSDKPSTKDPR